MKEPCKLCDDQINHLLNIARCYLTHGIYGKPDHSNSNARLEKSAAAAFLRAIELFQQKSDLSRYHAAHRLLSKFKQEHPAIAPFYLPPEPDLSGSPALLDLKKKYGAPPNLAAEFEHFINLRGEYWTDPAYKCLADYAEKAPDALPPGAIAGLLRLYHLPFQALDRGESSGVPAYYILNHYACGRRLDALISALVDFLGRPKAYCGIAGERCFPGRIIAALPDEVVLQVYRAALQAGWHKVFCWSSCAPANPIFEKLYGEFVDSPYGSLPQIIPISANAGIMRPEIGNVLPDVPALYHENPDVNRDGQAACAKRWNVRPGGVFMAFQIVFQNYIRFVPAFILNGVFMWCAENVSGSDAIRGVVKIGLFAVTSAAYVAAAAKICERWDQSLFRLFLDRASSHALNLYVLLLAQTAICILFFGVGDMFGTGASGGIFEYQMWGCGLTACFLTARFWPVFVTTFIYEGACRWSFVARGTFWQGPSFGAAWKITGRKGFFLKGTLPLVAIGLMVFGLPWALTFFFGEYAPARFAVRLIIYGLSWPVFAMAAYQYAINRS